MFFSVGYGEAKLISSPSNISVKLKPGEKIIKKVFIIRDKTEEDATMTIVPRLSGKVDKWVKTKPKSVVISKDSTKSYFSYEINIPKEESGGIYTGLVEVREFNNTSRRSVQDIIIPVKIEVDKNIKENTVFKCSETDNSIDYYIKGEAKNDVLVEKDYCLSDKILVEYYCNHALNTISKVHYTCPYICEDGACVVLDPIAARDDIKTLVVSNKAVKSVNEKMPSRYQPVEVYKSVNQFSQKPNKKYFYIGILLIFIGRSASRYARNVQKESGGVSRLERYAGRIMIIIGMILFIFNLGFNVNVTKILSFISNYFFLIFIIFIFFKIKKAKPETKKYFSKISSNLLKEIEKANRKHN